MKEIFIKKVSEMGLSTRSLYKQWVSWAALRRGVVIKRMRLPIANKGEPVRKSISRTTLSGKGFPKGKSCKVFP